MRIYLVCSTAKSWMNTGYGHSLLAGDQERLLVSFAEFVEKPEQQLAVTTMAPTYEPKAKEMKVYLVHQRCNSPPKMTATCWRCATSSTHYPLYSFELLSARKATSFHQPHLGRPHERQQPQP
jgi:hypothetical protein